MTENRVTPAQIDALMAEVTYYVHAIPDTTTTLAVAFDARGFSLATGLSACVDPANFDAELGAKYACEDAERKARAELWKLEGYRLKAATSGEHPLLKQLRSNP